MITYLNVQIHEYMISKASPVPQPNSPESSEPPAAATEQSCKTPVSPANTNAITEITEHEEQQHEVPLNENQEAEESRVSAHVAPVIPPATVNAPSSVAAMVQQHQPMVQKPADDRLFTIAAVRLALAIAVLLLKKLMKASGHGAVFMGQS
ncbi:hypothetical protein HanPI659440_Chr11g0442431 [Helianthus annuus]|nr:hypothetical protein HanPI659440_Chr11g0442431 [Helianthus annuus]